MVKIDQRLRDGKLIAVSLEKFGTHSHDYTSKAPMTLPSRWRIASTALLIAVSVSAADKPKDKKKNPDQIGNRNVAKGINFYSIEKEIALGKQLAEEVRRQS